ncbi:MAG: D-alanyl-D-alanine carboxypeptidase family protein [Ktedonobacterales bacterium]
MFAGPRKKARFQLDVPDRAESRAHLQQVGVRPARRRRKTLRFYPDYAKPRHRNPIPQQVAGAFRRLRQRYTTTLGERRQLWKGLVLAGLCVVLLVGASSPWLVSMWRSSVHLSSAARASGGALQYLNAAQLPRGGAVPPFPALAPHDTNPDRLSPDVLASSAFVFAPEQKWLLYQQQPDTQLSMASLTKLMTLLLAVEYGNLDQMVTVGSDAAALVNSNNSAMGLSAGERLSLRDLLYGLIVASGNDAAVAIADYVGGSTAYFVVEMNRRAAQLGLTNTTFVSPDGADDGNRTSARDLAMLAALVMEHPEVVPITSAYHYTIPQTATHKAYSLASGNDLLPGGHSTYPGANGIKTGYTESAAYCMAFSARVHGQLIVGVVLGDPAPGARIGDAQALLDWATFQES